MNKIFDLTRQLGEALMESDEYKKMKAAEEKAMGNLEAAEMMAGYLERRGQIQAAMEEDNPDPALLKRLGEEMDEYQSKLQGIDDISNMTAARGEFNGLINQINQVLQFIVTGRMEDDSECTGSCDTCGGCH